MKSFLAKKETVERNWRVVDASDQVLGRMAVKVATALMGKDNFCMNYVTSYRSKTFEF